jgi:hypothetical protein
MHRDDVQTSPRPLRQSAAARVVNVSNAHAFEADGLR